MTDYNTAPSTLPIVVGVSETTGSCAALRWAAAEAARRDAPVVAVIAWAAPKPPMPSGSIAPAVRLPEPSATGAAAQHTLETLVIATLGSVHGVHCRAGRASARPHPPSRWIRPSRTESPPRLHLRCRDGAPHAGRPADPQVKRHERCADPLGNGDIAGVVARQVRAKLPDPRTEEFVGPPFDGELE